MPDFLIRTVARCNLSAQAATLDLIRTRKRTQWSYCEPSRTRDVLICCCCVFHWTGCIAAGVCTHIRWWFPQSNTDTFNTPSGTFSAPSHLRSCATERKRLWPYWDVSVAFISQQETFKARWANVRGRSERLPAARGRKSGAVSSSSQGPCYDNSTWQIALLTHL